MGLLKKLDRHLADFLEANRQMSHGCLSQLDEEFLCCCERTRLAIKDFTNQGDDGKLSDCFPIAGGALCDLQWCLDQIFALGKHEYQIALHIRKNQDDQCLLRGFFDIERALFPLMWALGLRKTSINNSVYYSLDGRNCSGSTGHLPPGLNVDEIGEIEYLSDLGEGSQGMVYKAMWGRRSAHLPSKQKYVDDLGGTEYFVSESGSSGVYKAWGQLVAVKEVFSWTRSEGLEALESVVSRGNLYCELEVLKTLNHPNIVELKGYTRNVNAQGKYGLVMELMKCSLGDHLKSGKLSDLEKVDTLLQVARGMHFLHTVGIMHRDLKPANILIGELNYLPPNARHLRYVVAKLADFGLSKGLSKQEGLAADGAGWHTDMQGTSFYMAPELRMACNNAQESCAWYAMSADVFSFGTMSFNVLTGQEIPSRKGCPLNSEEFYRRIKKGCLDLFGIQYGQSKMAFLVRQCWCHDPRKRPTFLEICQILEDEKRRILCPSTSTSQMSPSMWINRLGPPLYSLGARNGLGEDVSFCETDEIEYFHEIHELREKAQGTVRIAIWRGVHLVAVKKVSHLQEMALQSHKLNHPNVVELKEHTMSGLVMMELMSCSLRDVLKVMPISELASINVLLQVARGMEFLHAEGILHLGLKPANILIGLPHHNAAQLEEVVAKITDFWSSRTQDEATDWGAYKQGNWFYMAPELYQDKDDVFGSARESADVFSFGSICVNVLTGHEIPCIGGHQDPLRSQEFYSRIQWGVVDELLQVISGESEIGNLVRECWCLDPDSRPPFVKVRRILEMEKSQILEKEKRQITKSGKRTGYDLSMKLKQAFYRPF